MLAPDCLNHVGNKNCTRIDQHFYFCFQCTREIGAQVGKKPNKMLRPKFAICNEIFTFFFEGGLSHTEAVVWISYL